MVRMDICHIQAKSRKKNPERIFIGAAGDMFVLLVAALASMYSAPWVSCNPPRSNWDRGTSRKCEAPNAR